jgi:cyclopropane fatty-acyl-phospholipid synthase-like methyltransferase
MANYDTFGRFYDAIMGDRAEPTERLRAFIRKASPKAKNVLELGCGTGSVLKHLAKEYDVCGLDLSKTMLSIAQEKVPQARLSRQDMALRANIDETLTAAIITEQGGKENHRERSQDCCSFCSQFA